MNKHWYLITHVLCPVCGEGYVYRTRMFTPKPELIGLRHKVEYDYQQCRCCDDY